MGRGTPCIKKFVSVSVSNQLRRRQVTVSGLRRSSEESPDFSSDLLSRNWRVVEQLESMGNGGLCAERFESVSVSVSKRRVTVSG
jgi:hypothetical protein